MSSELALKPGMTSGREGFLSASQVVVVVAQALLISSGSANIGGRGAGSGRTMQGGVGVDASVG